MHSARTQRITLAFVAVMALAQNLVLAQGHYDKMTDADVTALHLNHYFTADNKAHTADFDWTFTNGEFVIKQGNGKIPAFLIGKLLPKGETASEIRGKWRLDDKSRSQLILSSIKADGKEIAKEASLVIYRTAPTIVRIGDVQHVFEVRR